MIKYIDLENDYGAVVGSFGAPPPEGYTLQQYEDAYNNKLAIISAIEDAVAEGATEIIFNKTHITLTYEYYSNSGLAGQGESLIVLDGVSNLKIDWGHSTIEMMFDSDNKSPYHTSTSRPNAYQLNGKVFELVKCANIEFHNLTLIGEMQYRSFSNPSEALEEQTLGIRMGSIGGNFKGLNFVIEGFTGATVAGQNANASNNLLTVSAENQFRYFNRGYFNPVTGILEDNPRCYTTDWKTIDIVKNEQNNIYFKNFVQIDKVSGPNYTFTPNSLDHHVVFADEDYNVVGYGVYEKFQLIPLPPNAKYVRLQFINEPDHGEIWDVGAGVGGYSHTLIIPTWHDFVLENVTHRYCHRGAMTNIPHNSYIFNNKFYDNGITSVVFEGKPNFPDTTRYHWNNEEGWRSGIIVRDCYFGRGFTGALLVSNNVRIENCEFSGCNGITINKTNNTIIDSCRFYESSSGSSVSAINLTQGLSYGQNVRVVTVKNCYIDDAILMLGANDELLNTDLTFTNNTVRTSNVLRFSCPKQYKHRFKITDNVFQFKYRLFGAYNEAIFSNVKLQNNRFVGLEPDAVTDGLNRLRFILVNVSGTGNVAEYARITDTSGTFVPDSIISNSIIEGFTFNHCVITRRQYTNTSITSIYKKFKNCEFVNSTIDQSHGNNSYDWHSRMDFDNCVFVVDSTNSLVSGGFVNNSYNATPDDARTFEVNFKDCTLKNDAELDLKVLNLGGPAKTVRVKVENTVGKGIDIINNVTSGGKI